jgi:tetratricopeptide (TPR) repeat protein
MTLKDKLQAARAATAAKELDRAEALLREVLEGAPENLLALDLLGFVLYSLGRPEEGEKACRRALAVRPDHAYAHKGLGLNMAKRGGDIDEAVRHLKLATDLKPDWFDPYWDLLVTLLDARLFDQARIELERAREALPKRERQWAAMEQELERRSSTS